MNRVFLGGVLGVALLVMGAGCAPKEDPAIAAAAAEAVRLKAERVEIFGEAANSPDITWRSSGLGIQMLTVGEGASPKLADRVRVHYVGKLKDGTVFDESRAKGKPMDFAMMHVMASWAAGLSTMKAGGRALLFLPPELGYGSQRSGNIPPNSGLIFDIELLAVNPEPAAK
ncbi:FKBP-type peptidyl-prolyl cis-trans isomerase [Oleiharenicola lentus]|uniref:FKBP-type peptidyl-prolyl cis-trans isomerase n=1 Tax=Oleiharenicola lentus TaxID=2508720 RepID=UPI003F673974